ncbi:hypothetical protein DM860_016989 [Cuscuta australis]|uniref:Uncharacterized protein n=1 Tax=Cuscuta australis TaxID=267555 RepID=A0A328DNI8_9ASTE|nr:hypothetical protein DM860_016989 [Cuscuta australis]
MGYVGLKSLGIGLPFQSAAGRWGWDRYYHTNIWSRSITHHLLDVKNTLDDWVQFRKEVPAGDLAHAS